MDTVRVKNIAYIFMMWHQDRRKYCKTPKKINTQHQRKDCKTTLLRQKKPKIADGNEDFSQITKKVALKEAGPGRDDMFGPWVNFKEAQSTCSCLKKCEGLCILNGEPFSGGNLACLGRGKGASFP